VLGREKGLPSEASLEPKRGCQVGKFRSYANKYRRRYTVYAIGCAIAWAILLIVLEATESSHRMGFVWCVFGGWIIGWVSATIARFVYPPPAKWFRNDADRGRTSA
jgi:hypothetical protein